MNWPYWPGSIRPAWRKLPGDDSGRLRRVERFEPQAVEPGRAGPLAEPDQERGDPDAAVGGRLEHQLHLGPVGVASVARDRLRGFPVRQPAGSGTSRRPARLEGRVPMVRTQPLNRYQPPGPERDLLAERRVGRLRCRDAQQTAGPRGRSPVRPRPSPGRRRSRRDQPSIVDADSNPGLRNASPGSSPACWPVAEPQHHDRQRQDAGHRRTSRSSRPERGMSLADSVTLAEIVGNRRPGASTIQWPFVGTASAYVESMRSRGGWRMTEHVHLRASHRDPRSAGLASDRSHRLNLVTRLTRCGRRRPHTSLHAPSCQTSWSIDARRLGAWCTTRLLWHHR